MLAVITRRHTASLDPNNSRVRHGVAQDAEQIHLQRMNRSHVLIHSQLQDPILHRGRNPRLLMLRAQDPLALGSK